MMDKSYDSEFCGNLPLNFINSIQPYGFLMVMDHNHQILQISENLATLFNAPPGSFLNVGLNSFLSEKDYKLINSRLESKSAEKIPVNFAIKLHDVVIDFLVSIYIKDKFILMELELKEDNESFTYIYQDIKYITAKLKTCKSLDELVSAAAEEIKALSGFDKVMIYQFDENWNGLVIAESREAGMESYMGLRFPASDVPKQARDLYFKNPYRFIPDRDYIPGKIIPVLNPATFSYTDLTDTNLRGVAPVHLEYLKNMEVQSSMSTPIIIDNKLWGLIACHHKLSKSLSYEIRTGFELLSNILSAQISFKVNETLLIKTSELQKIMSEIYKNMVNSEDFADALLYKSPAIKELLAVDGAAIVYNGIIKTQGDVPPEAFIRDLCFWLKINNTENIFYSDNLQSFFDPESKYKDVASGILVLPVSSLREEFIIGFRKEYIQTIQWGGNPNEAIRFAPDNQTYHPRNSFSIWQETLKNRSAEWSAETLDAGKKLRSTVLEIIVRNNSSNRVSLS